ncbi:YhgE/Pip domain-containing protein [Companilactobacillus muriivasis]|uniref:YhgE/Pip domain-containing protein n=1 Tax=Companilactobacillus muriivasis TaxID=3081444 RepID=UPI0030C764C0
MIKAEWKYILKHKLMIIVFTVMIFIPSIYSVTFLKSMWNPYGELQDLPVAVVNHDQSVTYQGNKLAVGKNLTKSLNKSKAMNFHILNSTATANKGLTNGKYYMVITIPKNFSKNATTLLNKHPQKMVLHYETSAGHNFTASKMTASAAQKVAQSVSEQVTKTYSKTMFNSIKQLSNGMDIAATGSHKLTAGGIKVDSADKQITSGLDTLAKSSLTFSNGANTLNQDLKQYITGVNQAEAGSRNLSNGLNQLDNKSSALVNGLGQLSTGGKTLSAGLQNYTDGVSSINSSVGTLNSGAQALSSGTDKLSSSSNDLNSGLTQLHSASQNLTDNLQKVSSGLTDNTTQLNSSITTMKNQLATTNSDQATKLKSDLTNLQQAINNQSSTDVTTKISQVADQQGLTAAQKNAILAAVTDSNTDSLTKAADNLTSDVNQLMTTQAAAVTQLNDTQHSLTDTQDNLSTVIAQLAASSSQLTDKLSATATGMSQLNSGIGQIDSNTNKLVQGTTALNTGTNQLASKNSALLNGTNTLNNGLNEMNSQAPTLASGINQLDNGANTLTTGITKLATNGKQLTNGSSQLVNGANQISDGSQTLSTGSAQMGSGINQITNGNQTIAQQLATGAKKSNLKPTNLTYDQLAQPATTKHKERDKAPNNGTGMAPYMLSVSLFVGALAFNLMFDIYTPRKFPRTGVAWWASKSTVTGTFVIGEAAAAFILLNLIDDLRPVQAGATFIVLLLTGLMFMSIIYWLNLFLGKVGSFLSMILLVFQLGGSAGTYPIQLSNKFFQAIHPYLPMSYSVNALRQTLMIGDSAKPEMLVLLSITAVFSLLSISFFIRRKSSINEIDFTPEAAEHSLV